MTCTSGAQVSSGVRSGLIKSVCAFRLDASILLSLNETRVTCFGLERLFGFLIGFRGRPPSYKVWLNKTYKVGEFELPREGKLEIGGMDWKDADVPHPMACVHLNGMGGTSLQSILEKFIAAQEDIVTRIHAIELSRFFSNDLGFRFAVVMPILESYVRARYIMGDELSYAHAEKKFFKWIDAAKDNNIIEFSRKHVEIKAKKSPSLRTLISRAIGTVNTCGFRFPTAMAERLQRRRGRVFHSASQMSDHDAGQLFDEVRVATGLLMLHTYMDLGIDISCLARQYIALSDLREFLRPPEEPPASPPKSRKRDKPKRAAPTEAKRRRIAKRPRTRPGKRSSSR